MNSFAEAAELCTRLAPIDLDRVPVYVVPQTRVPADRGGRSAFAGFTHPTLDLMLKDVIGAEWRGRGAAMVIHQHYTADRELFASIVVHELAHVLDRPAPYSIAPVDEEPACLATRSRAVGEAVARPDRLADLAPETGHEWPFVRAVSHLEHRARELGVALDPFTLLPHSFYGLSALRYYRCALGDEPARMAGASFAEIATHAPPAGLRWLFDDDTRPPTMKGQLCP